MTQDSETPHTEAFSMPLIRCKCRCGKIWDVAFVPWEFAPQNAFRCSECTKWCLTVQLFRDGRDAPAISVSKST
jgi:hypothetical protein